MKSTIEYLDAAKAALGIESDYEMAAWLEVSRQAVSHWRYGRAKIDTYCAIRLAAALNRDPIEVIAATEFEKEKNSKRREFWASLYQSVKGKADQSKSPA